MKIKKNIQLAQFTTFKIGGPADYFVEAGSIDEVVKAAAFAKEKSLSCFVIGGGSNILIADKGVRGVVIRMVNGQWSVVNGNTDGLVATANINLSALVHKTVKLGLSGLEQLAGIPGTLGGAVHGNSGTKVGTISKAVSSVEVLTKDNKIKILKNKQCSFKVRGSRFRKTNEIILRVWLELKKEKKEKIKQNIKKALDTRRGQPKGKSVGSIFKNPKGDYAGRLIDKCGLKGRQIGDARISEKHANWIINRGDAKANDVVQLVRVCKSKVFEKFNIKLEEEITYLGEFNE